VKIGVLVAICYIPLFIVPAFALKQYENKEYGFSIKYPDNWFVGDELLNLKLKEFRED